MRPSAAPVGLGAKHLNFHAVAVHGGAHAVGGDVDVLVRARHRRVGHHKTIAIAMANQTAADHVCPARLTASRGWRIEQAKGRRASVRASLAAQREVVLLQIDDAFMAGETFEHVFQLARLA